MILISISAIMLVLAVVWPLKYHNYYLALCLMLLVIGVAWVLSKGWGAQ